MKLTKSGKLDGRSGPKPNIGKRIKRVWQNRKQDQWHPASVPPKPEDFEPTGQVLCITIFESGKIHPWFGTPKNQLADADYWRKITPPTRKEI